MKKVKRFLNSEFFNLCDVKSYNDFILSLNGTISIGIDKSIPQKIMNLCDHTFPYEKLDDYVKDSQSWLELKDKIDIYYESQNELRRLKHTEECILEEFYPKSLSIYKHTYTVLEKSEDDGDNVFIGDDVESTYTFYTNGYRGEIIEEFTDLLLPYYNDHYYNLEEKDLILSTCNEIHWLKQTILTFELAETLELKKQDIYNVFNRHKIKFFSNWSDRIIEYNDEKYYHSEIKRLVSDYNEAKKRKYIKGDKYINYPEFTCYIDFLKSLESGEYKIVEEDEKIL